MLRGLSEPPYFTWLRNLLRPSPQPEPGTEPEPQFLVRFFTELPDLWRTDSRAAVRRVSDRVRQQAGQLLAQGASAPERHLLMKSLDMTQIRMSGELDRFSVVSWWEPIADELSRHDPADRAAQDLLAVTLKRCLHNPNVFIQLSALLALNRLQRKPDPQDVGLRPVSEPSKAANPELAEWINQLLAGKATYPDPALFR